MNPKIENNFKSHSLTEENAARCDSVRDTCALLAGIIDEICPDSREKSLAMTNLEQVMFWANASIARNG